MVKKYVKVLEAGAYNPATDDTWKLPDVPELWRDKVESAVIADGYEFDDQGYAHKIIVVEKKKTRKTTKKKED